MRDVLVRDVLVRDVLVRDVLVRDVLVRDSHLAPTARRIPILTAVRERIPAGLRAGKDSRTSEPGEHIFRAGQSCRVSEQADDAALLVDVHADGGGVLAEGGHGLGSRPANHPVPASRNFAASRC